MLMTTNRVAAADAVLDEGSEVTNEDIGAVGVAPTYTARQRQMPQKRPAPRRQPAPVGSAAISR